MVRAEPQQRQGSNDQSSAVQAIQDLAQYAQMRRLTVADELLAEMLAALHRPNGAATHLEVLRSENRSMNVLRLMCQADAPRRSRRIPVLEGEDRRS
ncbi:hypothetical protein [Muricoccus radiodurans]|uniref:hypothetical protein n=1 Tax=Muricoccus radiodurans TaxID=2231721 RepID=UPI003CEA071D